MITYNKIYTRVALINKKKLGFALDNSSTPNPNNNGLKISAIAEITIKNAIRLTLFLKGAILLIYQINNSRSVYFLLCSSAINPA